MADGQTSTLCTSINLFTRQLDSLLSIDSRTEGRRFIADSPGMGKIGWCIQKARVQAKPNWIIC